jgi:hypothetical protein
MTAAHPVISGATWAPYPVQSIGADGYGHGYAVEGADGACSLKGLVQYVNDHNDDIYNLVVSFSRSGLQAVAEIEWSKKLALTHYVSTIGDEVIFNVALAPKPAE